MKHSRHPTERSITVTGHGRLYYEAPFDFKEIVSVTAIDGKIGYCDCCDERVMLTMRITTFAEDGYLAREDCGHILSEMNSFR